MRRLLSVVAVVALAMVAGVCGAQELSDPTTVVLAMAGAGVPGHTFGNLSASMQASAQAQVGERIPSLVAASGNIDSSLSVMEEAADRLERALERLASTGPRAVDNTMGVPPVPAPATFEQRLTQIGNHAHALADRMHGLASRLEAAV